MESKKQTNSQLFVEKTGPMNFYLGEGFDKPCFYDHQTWTEKIMTHGGKIVDSSTDKSIHLINLSAVLNNAAQCSYSKRYDCKFIDDSIERNELQNIDKYQLAKISMQESPVFKLDDYCLAGIFSYLSAKDAMKMEKVCEQWKRASQLSWNNRKCLEILFKDCDAEALDSPECSQNFFTSVEKLLTLCGPYLKRLKISVACDSQVLKIINKHCPNITTLILAFEDCYEEDFIGALSNLVKLRELDLTKSDEIPSFILSSIQNMSKTIHHLSFQSFGIEQAFFSWNLPIPQFESVRSLRISQFYLTEKDLSEFVKNTNLTDLILLDNEYSSPSILDQIFNLKSLEKLSISYHIEMVRFDDRFLNRLAENCCNLKVLKLQNTEYVTDTGVEAITKLKKLEELCLGHYEEENYNITDAAIQQLENLKKLEIGGCRKVTDSAVIKLLDTIANLEFLNVINTSITSKSLAHAATITRQRTNNIVLEIQFAMHFVKINLTSPTFTSPYLKLNEKKF